jgi:hypothetical protein
MTIRLGKDDVSGLVYGDIGDAAQRPRESRAFQVHTRLVQDAVARNSRDDAAGVDPPNPKVVEIGKVEVAVRV